ncbi:hypothetical protein KI387_023890, partial [Taxus chinensis]
MRVAVIGAGVSGLAAAYTLARAGVDVVLYEKEDYFGGHARTLCVDGIDVDLGFMICNRVTYSNLMAFFEELGVDLELSDMSFSVSLDNGKGCEWSSSNGLSGLFAQKSNALNPCFWQMIREIVKFKQDVLEYLKNHENNPSINVNKTLEEFIESNGYSKKFRDSYLIPICASIWSCSSEMVKGFSAASVLSFCRNHYLLQIFGRPQWLTVKGRSHTYVNKVVEELERRGCKTQRNCCVQSISATEQGILVNANGSKEIYDRCIVGAHAPDALKMLGNNATFDECRVLGAFQYVYSDIYVHRDRKFMPKRSAAWSSWNFLGSSGNHVCVTYWLNKLQNLGDTGLPFLVTLNPPCPPKQSLATWHTGHPVPSPAAAQASKELDVIQGKRGIWFCGAYQGYGFHEDGLKAGIEAAYCLLGERYNTLQDTRQMSPSWCETGARLVVNSFLQRYICAGCLCLMEDGGTIFQFEGKDERCDKKSVLRIHHPSFYWKIATRADLGLADAYIDGDFSFADGEEGLLNMFLILIANRDLGQSVTKKNHRRGWWTPMLITAVYWSATSFLQHVSKRNTLTQARRNISRHYDISNDFFSLFLDDTMTYSSAIFKGPEEPLKDAQLRKLHLLIDKARIDTSHEVLEIGCGWGSFAIEVVKRTGCKYTGITLSEEQLKLAQEKVKVACLQDKITLLLYDYRELPGFHKFNRIISCEMLESVGHEFIEEFFSRCEYLLAEDGLLVLQFISIPDKRYDEYRRSSDFIKEYIFPGGCLPSLSRTTSAMVAASNLCVEHVENIGIHYYQTLLCWRKNFHAHRSDILKLGFNDHFIRTWDYYFVYCAAGFKSLTLGDYQ